MLRKQLIVFAVFAVVMAAITALSYALTAADQSDCLSSVDKAEACR